MASKMETVFSPYVSIVTASRNDNYGGRLLERTENFLRTLSWLANENKLNTEIVFVDWNPPANKPTLKEAIRFPRDLKFLLIRFIEVPEEIHSIFAQTANSKTPFFEYHGKNVGVRRSRGKFVIITNNDLIYGKETFEYLAKKSLREDYFYRANRYEVDKEISTSLSVEKVQDFCEKQWTYGKTVNGSVYNFSKVSLMRYARSIISRAKSWTMKKLSLDFLASTGIHYGAPGDFILMSKSNWEKLRGFQEFPPSIGALDGYMCTIAAVSGLKQEIIPGKIYHQNHSGAEKEGRPSMTYEQFIEDAKKMFKSGAPIISNDNDWGLRKFNLTETAL